MRIRLIAAGTRLPDWVDAGVADYARRFGRGLKFELVEVPLAREAERMRQALREGDHVVALEVKGSAMTTEQLALVLDYTRRGNAIALEQIERVERGARERR